MAGLGRNTNRLPGMGHGAGHNSPQRPCPLGSLSQQRQPAANVDPLPRDAEITHDGPFIRLCASLVAEAEAAASTRTGKNLKKMHEIMQAAEKKKKQTEKRSSTRLDSFEPFGNIPGETDTAAIWQQWQKAATGLAAGGSSNLNGGNPKNELVSKDDFKSEIHVLSGRGTVANRNAANVKFRKIRKKYIKLKYQKTPFKDQIGLTAKQKAIAEKVLRECQNQGLIFVKKIDSNYTKLSEEEVIKKIKQALR